MQIRALWEVCFPDETGFNDYFFNNLYYPEQTILYCKQDEICAMTQMIPYELSLPDLLGTATYIYGACTHPAHRRQHLMEQLLEFSFQEDLKNHRIASMLIPAEQWLFDFYLPFGYKPAFYLDEQICYTTQNHPIRPIIPSELDKLNALYNQKMEGYAHIVRTAKNWDDQLQLFTETGKGVWGLWVQNSLVAYAFVMQEGKDLFAQELMAVDQTAAEQLCRGLLSQFHAEKIRYTTAGLSRPLGCIKRYDEKSANGYFNLMLN